MSLGAWEAPAGFADLTFLFQDKGRQFGENHRISKYNIFGIGHSI